MIIELYHDTVCPWCRIGKRHLSLALERWQGEPVEVHYRAYFLNDRLPPEGADFASVMHSKGGGEIPLESFFDAPRRMGEQAGLRFNFEQITRAPNTSLSHRLIALAAEDSKDALLDDIYAAYFEHGQDIGQLETLVEIGARHGLDPAGTRQVLSDSSGQDQVLEEARLARRLGITGVPFFIFDGRYAISGAQPPEAILQVMQRVVDERETPAG